MTDDLPDWALPEPTPDQRAEFNRAWDEAVKARGWTQLRCDDCGAGWWGEEGDGCWWCWQATENMVAEQTRLDRERLAELVGRVEDCDPAAVAPLVRLWRAAGGRLGNAARWRIAKALTSMEQSSDAA